jgi:predicted Kef-type K+ transport protein
VEIAGALAVTVAKAAAFVAVMLVGGRRVVPWVLHHAAHTGSRELFRLSVYAVALGVAYGAATLFGVSFAVGAFFAGMVLAESPLSQRATEEALPLRGIVNLVSYEACVAMRLRGSAFHAAIRTHVSCRHTRKAPARARRYPAAVIRCRRGRKWP